MNVIDGTFLSWGSGIVVVTNFPGRVGAADRAYGTTGAADRALGSVGAADRALGSVGAADRSGQS